MIIEKLKSGRYCVTYQNRVLAVENTREATILEALKEIGAEINDYSLI